MPSPFPCSPGIRECSWKKTQIDKKKKKKKRAPEVFRIKVFYKWDMGKQWKTKMKKTRIGTLLILKINELQYHFFFRGTPKFFRVNDLYKPFR